MRDKVSTGRCSHTTQGYAEAFSRSALKATHQWIEMGIRRSWSLHQASKSWLRLPHDHVGSKKLAIARLEMQRSEWFLADHLTAAWLCLKHKII
jgi:hypothetical protein